MDRPVLITNDDGVLQVAADGAVTTLVTGPVAAATDDTEGGLLYQVERGPSGEPGDRSTVVWWIPQGASAPQELLVPTPSSGHRLTLHDATRTADGFAVLYSRHDTAVPVDAMVDSLRRYEVPGGQVSELYSQGSFEQGYREPTFGGELISAVRYDQVSSGCLILQLDGRPTDLVPVAAYDPSVEQQIGGCALSPDGTRLGYVTEHAGETIVHLWRIDGSEEARFVLPSSDGHIGTIDLSDRMIIVNLERDGPEPAVVFDIDAPEAAPRRLPTAGVARFVAGRSVAIGREAVSATTTRPQSDTQPTSTAVDQTSGSLVLRADGLGTVEFGQPADEVIRILEQVVGSPPSDPGDAAGWVEYVGWRELGLYVGFDTPISGDFTGVSRLVGWDYWSADGLGLVTEAGVGIGSSLAEARAVYGDRFQTYPEPDECSGLWTYLITSSGGDVAIVGTLDRSPADDARIASAHAGVGVGC